jgi:hypothetical protein
MGNSQVHHPVGNNRNGLKKGCILNNIMERLTNNDMVLLIKIILPPGL